MVSLDSREKAEHFMQQVTQDRTVGRIPIFCCQVAADNSPYFWAGGRISPDKRRVTWENGRGEGIR